MQMIILELLWVKGRPISNPSEINIFERCCPPCTFASGTLLLMAQVPVQRNMQLECLAVGPVTHWLLFCWGRHRCPGGGNGWLRYSGQSWALPDCWKVLPTSSFYARDTTLINQS